jgi:hypothetical protein
LNSKNKTEAKLLEFLKSYPQCKTQIRFDWCRFSQTNNIMPFDFGVDKILIEVDGEQHFQQISNWNDVYDWRSIIQKEIELLKNEEASCVFISSTAVYQTHIMSLTSDIKYKNIIIEKNKKL